MSILANTKSLPSVSTAAIILSSSDADGRLSVSTLNGRLEKAFHSFSTKGGIKMILRMNVPVARDGTYFRPMLCTNGGFTVGDKMAERRFKDFNLALAYLKAQPEARWRRPNSKGNRGIVTAIKWEEHEIDFSEVSPSNRQTTKRTTIAVRYGDRSAQAEQGS